MSTFAGMIAGFLLWFFLKYMVRGLYTVNQDERAVKTSFGRAQRIKGKTTLDDPITEMLREKEKERYVYPQVRVIQPGGPYFKWPWEKVYKASIATQTVNMAYDMFDPTANRGGTVLEAVTKDQLNIGLTGQIRYRVAERNMYAYLFGIKHPVAHVMGYFVSVLRERIASYEAPDRSLPFLDDAGGLNADVLQAEMKTIEGISINDLRKNLSDINDHMEQECLSSAARYGILLDASLITGIDPPAEVDSALAAINTAHNHVSSDISLARASADQRIVQSKRAVEIETLKALAEVEPLNSLAAQLEALQASGSAVLQNYLRSVRLQIYGQASHAIMEEKK
jgi:regulator of protease activity HflC (stomatin/prohibitin superfamily)